MASVLHRTTKQFIRSANTPDFNPADWIINPDMSAVEGQPSKYWVITGDVVSLADQATQDAIDAQLEADLIAHYKDLAKSNYDSERLLKAFAEVMIDEINILRAQHSLADRTADQLRTALRNKIDAAS